MTELDKPTISFISMLRDMFRLVTAKLKIFNIIVQPVAIFMVYFLGWFKESPPVSFPNPTVFHDIAIFTSTRITWDIKKFVTTHVYFPSWVTLGWWKSPSQSKVILTIYVRLMLFKNTFVRTFARAIESLTPPFFGYLYLGGKSCELSFTSCANKGYHVQMYYI